MRHDAPVPTTADGARASTRRPTASDEVPRSAARSLDVDDLVVALAPGPRAAARGSGWPRSASSSTAPPGPTRSSAMVDLGYDVFVDLKLHDIPTTVGKAARVLGSLGARYLTLHALGGVDMLRAGVEGLREGAAQRRAAPSRPRSAVTVLTSDDDAPAAHPAQAGAARGRGGLRRHRLRGAPTSHEARPVRAAPHASCPASARPARRPTTRPGRPRRAEALDAGADLLVIGRAVTAGRRPGRRGGRWSTRSRPDAVRPGTGVRPRRADAWRCPDSDHAQARVRTHATAPSPHARAAPSALDKAAEARRGTAELKETLKMGSVNSPSCSSRATTTTSSAR